MTTLCIDTATTRFYTDRATKEEPHLVRLAWALGDKEPETYIVRLPQGATIDPSSARYHGVTLAQSVRNGVTLADVLSLLKTWADHADELAAFNGAYHFRQLDRTAPFRP